MSNTNQLDHELLKTVPPHAINILDAGCGTGLLGQALKKENALRYVAGIDKDKEACALASRRLDAVFALDLESDSFVQIAQRFDTILLSDVLGLLIDPLHVLQKLYPLLDDQGELILSVFNVQHYSTFRRLLKGDFQGRKNGSQNIDRLRHYCLANVFKLLLDAGYLPRLHHRIIHKDRDLEQPLAQLCTQLGLPESNLRNFETLYFQVAARRRPTSSGQSTLPFCIGVYSKYASVLKDNIYTSAVCSDTDSHQILVYKNEPDIATAWNKAIAESAKPYVVLMRDYVYLPRHWDQIVSDQIRHIEQLNKSNWVAGIAGATLEYDQSVSRNGASLVADQNRYAPLSWSAPAQTLEDNLLIMPVATARKLDPLLGEFFHGADIALRVRESGGHVYTLNAPCLNNSPFGGSVPPGQEKSRVAFRKKWSDALPVAVGNQMISPD